jgi:hypothetical protein
MIKLTLNPDIDGEVKNFNKTNVVIGSAEKSIADFSLPGENLEPVHIKIEQTENDYYVLNVANDPFVTLNGLFFGRKRLIDNDIIQVGSTLILFNAEHSSQIVPESAHGQNFQFAYEKENWLDTGEEKLHQLVEKKILSKNQDPSLAAFNAAQMDTAPSDILFELSLNENKKEELAAESWLDDKELQELLEEAYQLEAYENETEQQPTQTSSTQIHSETPIPPQTNLLKTERIQVQEPLTSSNAHPTIDASKDRKGSLKDYYLSEFDDESEVWNQHKKTILNETKISLKRNWKAFGMIASIIFLVIFTIIAFFFLNLRARNHEDELEAIEGVADIAMALAFAQLNHIKPLNQNWSDLDFLRNNLMAVLASEYSPAPFFDNHGQFKNSEYSLRIYSSADLSQSLIIAQPAPSLLQWLVPKASILVDSKSMEIRRTTDLKSLNRLLLNPNTLEGINAIEVSNLVKQYEIIPFSVLSAEGKDLGYILTKSLSLIHPEAKNAVYNAPRYYPFGETILKKALMVTDNYVNPYERSLVQEEIKRLAKYPNLILYTTKGMKWLLRAQKAVGILYPSHNFLFATLGLSPQGKILDSHLVMDTKALLEGTDEDLQEFALLMEQNDKFNAFELDFNEPMQDVEPSPIAPDDIAQPLSNPASIVDTKHPLYRELLHLSTLQKKAALSFEIQLEALLEIEHREDIIFFLNRLQSVLKKAESTYQDEPQKSDKNQAAITFLGELVRIMNQYQATHSKEQQSLTLELSRLQQSYSHLPLSEFIAYVQAAGLRGFGFDEIKQMNNIQQESEILESKIQTLLKNIQLTDNLAFLENNLTELVNVLTLDKISDPKKLIDYQNEIRLHVLRKLNDFLLTSGKTLPLKEFVPENRPVLANILKTAWVNDPDEFDFYLNEFDLRLQNMDSHRVKQPQD